MSTSILVKKLEAYIATNKKESYVIQAMDSERAEYFLKDYDVVLVGPQIRYTLQRYKKALEGYNIPVAVINPTDYGIGNVEAILNFAESLVQEQEK
jgi:PTS system cellobiose-specific IIB component